MRYLSVCSGIEAATVAWHSLGWTPVAFSEIESFPSAVLKHHYPSVPNWGDMTRCHEWPDATVDLLVGGTPCQSFSVAGLRTGLADPRGNLALTYLAILDRYRPTWCCWENVPGVLSSGGGRDVGAFLGGLGELGYGWAYRVLDAQYFGVAQRRRRVFVVGHLGSWQRAAAVLFDAASLSGHPAPRRETGQGVAGTLKGGSGERGYPDPSDGNGGGLVQEIVSTLFGSGAGTSRPAGTASETGFLVPEVVPSLTASGRGVERTGESRGQDPVVVVPFIPEIVPQAMSAKWAKGTSGPAEDEVANLVAHALRADGFDASEDGTGRGTPLVPVPATTATLDASYYRLQGASGQDANHGHSHLVPIAFSVKDYGADAGEIAPTLRAGGHYDSHANGGVMPAVAFEPGSIARNAGPSGESDLAPTLRSDMGDNQPAVRMGMAVRRLTPLECARLQGFPDDYLDIPYRGKPAADGPKYKALGNSMAVPVMRWIGERIQRVEALV